MLDSGLNLEKTHTPLDLDWYADKTLVPTCLYLEHGGIYGVDRSEYDGLHASRSAGGFGYRYTLRTSCECEDEENYNKLFFLYLELYGTIGRWDCDDAAIEMVRVRWDDRGCIDPILICLEDGPTYQVTEIISKYPMSRRKSDGAGMRYIVKASCTDLQDNNRIFPLMLEEGGEFVGTWFLEDYTAVDRRMEKLQLTEYR